MKKSCVLGIFLVGISAIAFIYYTIWVIIMPFVDVDQWVHSHFPDRKLALIVPTIGFTILTGFVGLLTAFNMMVRRQPAHPSHNKTL